MKGLNTGTAIYSLVLSIFLLIAPLLTLGAVVGDAVTGETSAGTGFDMFIRVAVAVMLGLGVTLLIKDKVASKAGKILIIISGAIVIVFSSLAGFPAGVVGIVGASLLLASIKKYKTVTE